MKGVLLCNVPCCVAGDDKPPGLMWESREFACIAVPCTETRRGSIVVWPPFGKIPKHTFYSNQIASDTRLHVDYRHAVGCRDAVERWMPGTVKLKMTGDWSVPSR